MLLLLLPGLVSGLGPVPVLVPVHALVAVVVVAPKLVAGAAGALKFARAYAIDKKIKIVLQK